MDEGLDVSHEGNQMKRSLPQGPVNKDNDNNSINSRKRRTMEGRLDRVMEIDLSVRLEELENGESEVKEKGEKNSVNSVDVVNINGEEEEGEAMEDSDEIHSDKKSSARASVSFSDSENGERSKIQIELNGNVQSDRSLATVDCSPPRDLIVGSQLETLHGEVDRIKEENKRLKVALSQLMNNYQNLQMHLFRVMQQEQQEENSAQPVETSKEVEKWEEESELVHLSLGTNPPSNKATDEETRGESGKEGAEHTKRSQGHLKGFSLSLDFKDEDTSGETNEGNLSPPSSPTKSEGGLMKSESLDIAVLGQQHQANRSPESICRVKEEGMDHRQQGFWQSNKAIKTSHEAGENSEPAPPIRKARVSVRARCEAPTMNDGCQWRKYGQKIAKGNPCPRAYYRCTVAPGCPVRKQVQRCPDEMAILITTYEGSHNHPLPMAATAMASTTSAAACMLLSGSTSSMEAMNSNNPYISRLDQCFASNPTISTSSSFPTITLDLTKNPTSQLNLRNSIAAGSSSTSLASTFPLPFRYPSAGSNMLSNPHLNNTILRSEHSLPVGSSSNPWSSTHLYYGQPPPPPPYARPNSSISTTTTTNYDLANQRFQNPLDSSLNNPAARAIQGVLSRYSCQSLIQNVMSDTSARSTVTTSNTCSTTSSTQHSLADSVSAATAAITSDPNFTNALVNAIASIISQGTQTKGGASNGGNNIVPNSDQRKWGEPITDPAALRASPHTSQNNILFSSASVPFSGKHWPATENQNR